MYPDNIILFYSIAGNLKIFAIWQKFIPQNVSVMQMLLVSEILSSKPHMKAILSSLACCIGPLSPLPGYSE